MALSLKKPVRFISFMHRLSIYLKYLGELGGRREVLFSRKTNLPSLPQNLQHKCLSRWPRVNTSMTVW
eukprot:scaffold7006_cov174-Skeletonema_marinoi.AAC.28